MQKPNGFVDIAGYEGLYAVSKNGEVYSYPKNFRDGFILKGSKDVLGYPVVCLSNKYIRIHRLVAMTFINNPENKKCVNHKNHDRSDNRIENLEWCTNSENIRFQKPHKRKNKKSRFKGIMVYNNLKKNKYRARICFNREMHELGFYKTEIDAAKAYNKKAIELFGKFAYLNNV